MVKDVELTFEQYKRFQEKYPADLFAITLSEYIGAIEREDVFTGDKVTGIRYKLPNGWKKIGEYSAPPIVVYGLLKLLEDKYKLELGGNFSGTFYGQQMGGFEGSGTFVPSGPGPDFAFIAAVLMAGYTIYRGIKHFGARRKAKKQLTALMKNKEIYC